MAAGRVLPEDGALEVLSGDGARRRVGHGVAAVAGDLDLDLDEEGRRTASESASAQATTEAAIIHTHFRRGR